ncbi:MAG: phosphatase PAP2 family protein [Bacteroidetes bacterium]|nr:phosphatase PAP2 family protein [Bacteroidota bacterium]
MMVDFLYNIDVQVFYFINRTLANPVTDSVMPFITELNHWKIFYVIMWLYMMISGGRRGRVAGILVLFLVLITDQVSSNLVKHLIERARPCSVLPNVHLLVGCTGSFSFPSSHAVNNFAGAVFFSHFYPRYTAAFYTAAILMALSRVFCGVHYPSDILGGMMIGIILGFLFIKAWELINKKIKLI